MCRSMECGFRSGDADASLTARSPLYVFYVLYVLYVLALIIELGYDG
jgi:hypothetical protein